MFTDPFGDTNVAYLERMNLNASSFLKCDADMIVGYMPVGNGNNFSHCDVVTYSRNWTVPAGVTNIRVVMIGGGQGGSSGCRGADGGGTTGSSDPVTVQQTYNQYWEYYLWDDPDKDYLDQTRQLTTYVMQPGTAGNGGAGGTGGSGGKVLIQNISVSPGATYTISIGYGGAGGVYSETGSVAGSLGSATTFGSYSSDNGVVPSGKYHDPVSGGDYAMSGYNGVDGGSGSGDNINYTDPGVFDNGSNVVMYDGSVFRSVANNGLVANMGTGMDSGIPIHIIEFSNGGTGGAAVGSNGQGGVSPVNDGTLSQYFTASARTTSVQWYGNVSIKPAKGQDGANASQLFKPTAYYGQGGTGGNGGGGGGGDTGIRYRFFRLYNSNSVTKLSDGTYIRGGRWYNTGITSFEWVENTEHAHGGDGSNGGAGSNGACLIYY